MRFLTTYKQNHLSRIIAAFIVNLLCLQLTLPPTQVLAQVLPNLPKPGTLIEKSEAFTPALIIGMTLHPENPFAFDFIIHPGQSDLQGSDLRLESQKLTKYFMAALTVPEDEMWVNLSPYEKDRIIPEGFGDTEMGRDLLAQDYILKQLTASLMYPEDQLGSEFWKRVHQRAYEEYGTTEVPMDTFNKVWIVPESATIYENGLHVFVTESRMKVLLEEDYLALEANRGNTNHGLGEVSATELTQVSELSSKVIREIIIPEIEREVNEGKTFANLRQISNSVILATWYKQNIQQGMLNQVYVNQNKTNGIDIQDKEINQKIYDQYILAFKKGVYNFIKEEYDPATKALVPRKYFSGGAVEDWRGKIDLAMSAKDLEATLSEALEVSMRIEGVTERTAREKILAALDYLEEQVASGSVGVMTHAMFYRAAGISLDTYYTHRGNSPAIASRLDQIIGVENTMNRALEYFEARIESGDLSAITPKEFYDTFDIAEATYQTYKSEANIAPRLNRIIGAKNAYLRAIEFFETERRTGRLDAMPTWRTFDEKAGITAKVSSPLRKDEDVQKALDGLSERFGKPLSTIDRIRTEIERYRQEFAKGEIGLVTNQTFADGLGLKREVVQDYKRVPEIAAAYKDIFGPERAIMRAIAFYKKEIEEGRFAQNMTSATIWKKANVGSSTLTRNLQKDSVRAAYDELGQLLEPIQEPELVDTKIAKAIDSYEAEIKSGRIGYISQVMLAENAGITPSNLNKRKSANPSLGQRIDAIAGGANAVLRAIAYYDKILQEGTIDYVSRRMVAVTANLDDGTVREITYANSDVQAAFRNLDAKVGAKLQAKDAAKTQQISQALDTYEQEFAAGKIQIVRLPDFVRRTGLSGQDVLYRRIRDKSLDERIKQVVGVEAAILRAIAFFREDQDQARFELPTWVAIAEKAGVTAETVYKYASINRRNLENSKIFAALAELASEIAVRQEQEEQRQTEILVQAVGHFQNEFQEGRIAILRDSDFVKQTGLSRKDMATRRMANESLDQMIREIVGAEAAIKRAVDYFKTETDARRIRRLTVKDMADKIGINVGTIYRYNGKHREALNQLPFSSRHPLWNEAKRVIAYYQETHGSLSWQAYAEYFSVSQPVIKSIFLGLGLKKTRVVSEPVQGYQLRNTVQDYDTTLSDNELDELLSKVAQDGDVEAVAAVINSHLKEIDTIVRQNGPELTSLYAEERYDRLFSEAYLLLQEELLPKYLQDRRSNGRLSDYILANLPALIKGLKNSDLGHYREFSLDVSAFDEGGESYGNRLLADQNEVADPEAILLQREIDDPRLLDALAEVSEIGREIVISHLGFDASLELIAVNMNMTLAEVEAAFNAAMSQMRLAGDGNSDEPVGGIDFNPNHLNLNTQGNRINIQFSPAMNGSQFDQVDRFVPVIINISPVTNIPFLLGEVENRQNSQISHLQ